MSLGAKIVGALLAAPIAASAIAIAAPVYGAYKLVKLGCRARKDSSFELHAGRRRRDSDSVPRLLRVRSLRHTEQNETAPHSVIRAGDGCS